MQKQQKQNKRIEGGGGGDIGQNCTGVAARGWYGSHGSVATNTRSKFDRLCHSLNTCNQGKLNRTKCISIYWEVLCEIISLNILLFYFCNIYLIINKIAVANTKHWNRKYTPSSEKVYLVSNTSVSIRIT